MALIKCRQYELRHWKDGDFSTEGARVASYSLYENNNQVGAAYTLENNVLKDIKTDPEDGGHGTKLLEILMKRAKTLGHESFKVLSVTGQGKNSEEIKKNREKMEYILKKLGFIQTNKDENNWEIHLNSLNTNKIGC